MAFDFVQPSLVELKPRISVIGVGGAGGNAVANMIADDLKGVDFVVANTDAQALMASTAPTKIQLGLKITQGLGAGARPEIGAAAAEEALAEIDEALEGVHMCFITAGMGGGTGTGAAPVVARAARERGVLTVGVVTKPFAFEGLKRMRAADEGIAELQRHVDTLIVIPNQNLFLIANQQTTFKEAFAMADQVLNQGVRGITDLMILPGLINLDFADVRTVMSEMGKAMMGTGEAEGERRAIEAAERAISNPLLDEVSLRGAKAVIINITGGEDLGLMEVEEAAQHIREMVDAEANIIVGSAFSDSLNGKMRVSVVATGIESENRPEQAPTGPERGQSSIFGGRPASIAPAMAAAPAARGKVAATARAAGESAAADTLAAGETAAETAGAPEAAAPAIPVAEEAAAADDGASLSDDDILELGEPLAPGEEAADEAANAASTAEAGEAGEVGPAITELPLAAPRPRPAAQRPPEPAPQPQRRQTLFERMMQLSRKQKEEPVTDLAPEPQAEEESDTRIPPFMRRQRNG